jgi:hypothetical protein
VRDVVEGLFYLFAGDRTFTECALDAVAQLGLIERLAPVVSFDDVRHHEFRRLERRESLRARQALTPTAHLATLACKSRIDDLRIDVCAERTVHGGLD